MVEMFSRTPRPGEDDRARLPLIEDKEEAMVDLKLAVDDGGVAAAGRRWRRRRMQENKLMKQPRDKYKKLFITKNIMENQDIAKHITQSSDLDSTNETTTINITDEDTAPAATPNIMENRDIAKHITQSSDLDSTNETTTINVTDKDTAPAATPNIIENRDIAKHITQSSDLDSTNETTAINITNEDTAPAATPELIMIDVEPLMAKESPMLNGIELSKNGGEVTWTAWARGKINESAAGLHQMYTELMNRPISENAEDREKEMSNRRNAIAILLGLCVTYLYRPTNNPDSKWYVALLVAIFLVPAILLLYVVLEVASVHPVTKESLMKVRALTPYALIYIILLKFVSMLL